MNANKKQKLIDLDTARLADALWGKRTDRRCLVETEPQE